MVAVAVHTRGLAHGWRAGRRRPTPLLGALCSLARYAAPAMMAHKPSEVGPHRLENYQDSNRMPYRSLSPLSPLSPNLIWFCPCGGGADLTTMSNVGWVRQQNCTRPGFSPAKLHEARVHEARGTMPTNPGDTRGSCAPQAHRHYNFAVLRHHRRENQQLPWPSYNPIAPVGSRHRAACNGAAMGRR
jgi:hypothetical protein